MFKNLRTPSTRKKMRHPAPEDRLLKQQNGHGSLAEDEKIPIAPSDAPMPLMTVEDAFSPDPPSQQNDTDATSDHTDFDEDSQESHYDRKKS